MPYGLIGTTQVIVCLSKIRRNGCGAHERAGGVVVAVEVQRGDYLHPRPEAMTMPSDVPSIVALVGLYQASITLTNGERKSFALSIHLFCLPLDSWLMEAV